MSKILSFSLDRRQVKRFENEPEPFDNAFAKSVYLRSYSRLKPDGTKESWYETCLRVVNGVYSIQKDHVVGHGLDWNERKAQRSAKNMFERIFTQKFTPPGRGLCAMGVPAVHERKMFGFLFNCAFVSTDDIDKTLTMPFVFAMHTLLVGCGMGFDTRGEGKINIYKPGKHIRKYVIEDSREGWVDSVQYLLQSYFYQSNDTVEFDYSNIRPKGALISSLNVEAPGHEPLKQCHELIVGVLERNVGSPITITTIVDLFNIIGKAVVSGGIRRSAEIALGDESDEFLSLKDADNDDLISAYRHNSNNSVIGTIGMDYTDIANRAYHNGEPGVFWVSNAQEYGRMGRDPDYKDANSTGTNPCSEQTLESYEMCNLTETFISKHDNLEDFLITLKYAYLFSKTVALTVTDSSSDGDGGSILNYIIKRSNGVMVKNRRLGNGLSGIADFLVKENLGTLKEWCERGYDRMKEYDTIYSKWLGINESIKLTTVKPSGTVSSIASVTPGVHFPTSKRYYIRRVEFRNDDGLLPLLRSAGYLITKSHYKPDMTSMVWFPVEYKGGSRASNEVSMWEKLELAACMQAWWSDNQVSVTITFDRNTEGSQIANALNYYQYRLKSVSFLPMVEGNLVDLVDKDEYIRYNGSITDDKPYRDLPYEEITEAVYIEHTKNLKEIDYSNYRSEAMGADATCDKDIGCEIRN